MSAQSEPATVSVPQADRRAEQELPFAPGAVGEPNATSVAP